MRTPVFFPAISIAVALAAVSCYGGLEAPDGHRVRDASYELGACVPGDVKRCPCPGGAAGAQTCAHDGSRWGTCEGCAFSVGDSGPEDVLPDHGGGDAGTGDAGGENTEDSGLDAGNADAGHPDGGSSDASPAEDGGGDPDGGQPIQPEDRRPCESGTCWTNDASLWRCGSFTVDEDFSSGKYNVHEYHSGIWTGAPTRIALDRTGGTWQPALIVSDAADGAVLFDGSVGIKRMGLEVNAVLDGRSGARAEVEISSGTDFSVIVYVTGWEVVLGGFADFLPTSAAYGLSIENDCGGPVVPCVVNGNALGERTCGWLHYIARNVVPLLEGTRDERLTVAARVAWWSLKEGVLFRPNPLAYSYCGAPGGGYIEPLESCAGGYAWQVGLSGVQVPTFDLAELEAAATRLFPVLTVDEVLYAAAREALLSDADAAAVAGSSDALRRSWLLRTSAVGFTVQETIVTSECVDRSLSWCYGTGWDATRWYAPDREHALIAMDDVRAILDLVAP